MKGVLGAISLLLAAGAAQAQVDPLSIIGRAVTTAMDVRTKAEVAADVEIAADANKRLVKDKRAQWSGVTVMTFAQHVVLAGAVKSAQAKQIVEEVVQQDKRIRSFRNELLVGDLGSLVKDTALEAKINAALTAAKGVASVNMRWTATGGRVVLMGVAQSQQEAGVAVAKARAVDGVKSLKSHLRVVPKKG